MTILLVAMAAQPNAAQVTRLDESIAPDLIRQSVIEFVQSYHETLSYRDWQRFAEHFWSGATIVTIWTPAGESAERVYPSTVSQFVERAPEGPGSREIFEEGCSPVA